MIRAFAITKPPARPAGAPAPDLGPTDARLQIPSQLVEKSTFGRGFAPQRGPGEGAPDPLGLAASRWWGTAASAGALAAAGA